MANGTGGGLESLAQNQLLLQYMAGAGGALSSGQDLGSALSNITIQNIAAQNQAKLLQNLLAGGPAGGGTPTATGAGAPASTAPTPTPAPTLASQPSITDTTATQPPVAPTPVAPAAPTNAGEVVAQNALMTELLKPNAEQAPLFNMLMGTPIAPAGTPLAAPPLAAPPSKPTSTPTTTAGTGAPTKPTDLNGMLGNILNPSGSPLENISPADLAGLTPSDITQAAGLATQVRAQQSKTALGTLKELNQDERTSAIKNYEYAQSQGFTGSFDEFQNDAKTSHIKDYEFYRGQGGDKDFNSWLRDITALGGGLSLSEFKARKQITGLEQRKDHFKNPKGLASDLNKFINSEDVQNEFLRYETAKELNRAKAVKAEEYIDQQLQASDAVVIEKRLDGNTFVWEIKWPDGSKQEVRHAVKFD